MDAHETVWIEACFQSGNGLLLEMFFSLAGQRHVVVLGFRVVKLGNRNERNLRAVFHYQTFQELLWRPRGGREFVRGRHFLAQPVFRSFQCRIKALASDGLQQIVDGVDIEGAHRVFVVRGHEDDGHFGTNQFEDIESRQFGHLHVEKDQIRFVLRDGLHGFDAVGAFGGDFDFRMGLQKLANHVARELFVIDDERLPSFVLRGAHSFSSLSAGRDKLT